MSYKIDWGEAKIMIKMFINKLGPGTTFNLPIGGTIAMTSMIPFIKSAIVFKGLMAWFCWDTQNKYFFLAFEQNDNYDPVDEIDKPENDDLQAPHPKNIFSVPAGANVDQFLDDHTLNSAANPDLFLPKATVIQMKEDYKLYGPQYSAGKPLNKLPYSFFENEAHPDITNFRRQPSISAMRYYFGYDPTLSTNQIRVILVPVDAQGRNIIPTGVPPRTQDVVWMLEQSWPPPPPL